MNTDNFDTNKRIAKNTLFLYGRMLVMMAVSLFTFRELLKLLGVDSYGTYNAVGGIIILFSFLSHALTQSNQRFLSFNIGKEDQSALDKTFSMIINVQLIIGGAILFLAETVGLWFLNYKMNFEGEDMIVVNIVFQFTIITFLVQLMQIPYTSSIIAHERMKTFSYVSICDAILRLTTVLLLSLFCNHRLILYAVFLSFDALCILFLYQWYCKKNFQECTYSRIWDKGLLRNLLNLSVWNMVGGLGTVVASQGINILFNIFGGVVLNAAWGVSNQVHSAVNSLVGNMQTAFNPQIIKSFAKGDIQFFDSLIFRASRFSFFLISIVGIPFIICMKDILSLWLTDVPDYSVAFTQFTIIYCMVESLSGPLWIANQAYGKVRNYMIVVALITLSSVPVGYILLKRGFDPTSILVVRIVMSFILLFYRIIYLKITIHFPIMKYLVSVGIRVCLSIVLMLLICAVIIDTIKLEGFLNIIISGGVSFIISTFIGFLLLFSKNEKNLIVNKIKSYGDR